MKMDFDNRVISIELWIDEPRHRVLTKGYFRELNDHGIDSIAIMIDESDRKWKSTWGLHDIEKALELADPYAIEVILTIWPYPSMNWMNLAFRDLKAMCEVGPIAAIEADLEFNWKSKHVEGFIATPTGTGRLERAGKEYVDRLQELVDDYQIRKEMTTFTSHTENGRAATVAPHMDCLLVQAYATRHRPGARGKRIEIPWDHVYGPGYMQRYTLDRTMLVPGVMEKEVEVGYGHALWDQHWPGHKPMEAMMMSFSEAIMHSVGVTRVRCWSSKWRKRNAYASEFLTSIVGGVSVPE